MKITYKSDYALKAVLDLALCYEGREPVSIHDTAKRIDAPVKFLEQIFSGLKAHGVIESRRGSNGGYLLAKPPEKITIGDIIAAAQGPIVPVRCLAEDEAQAKDCEILSSCITRHVWKETQKLLVDYYDSVSIADLCSIARKQGVSRDLDHKYMYLI